MKINKVFFSPTGGTKKIVDSIALNLQKLYSLNDLLKEIDFTLPDTRKSQLSFEQDELVVIGIPVYAGRVPNILLKYLKTIKAKGSLCVAVVSYGNRNFDDALIEFNDILTDCGFKVIALGAFISEHSFSKVLAANRPDLKDLNICKDFSEKIADKLKRYSIEELLNSNVEPDGQRPYRFYYVPKSKEGEKVDFRKIKPKTNENCIQCKVCAENCPMGSISFEDAKKIEGICIKCGACSKKCPVQAKYYDDLAYLHHKEELEVNFSKRREPVFFL